ncbi:Peptidase C1 and/or Inhibitor I29 domain containing protein [Asbolus verrucosus]|uniref:Peptidase C1 and/or Inhibitor I29 domain containing protein n=1 Tax=Asbolus verrucosus TaxID=1661398 RepID=A0A482VDF0_ASBVE|nr:Peptidase C1 and/or Inhibitor I29 domain containing protein [Asbolus verrucosus]
MKLLIILFVTIYACQALLTQPTVSETWNNFKRSHRRRFSNSREERFRKTVFQKKLQQIEDHNERFKLGMETYEIGVNEFTDYTEEEMMSYTHGFQLPLEMPAPLINITSNSSFILRSGLTALPSSLDWRSRGVVTPVKDQGQCGSCWAFSVNGALESHYKIRYGATVTLSEQQLVDCATNLYGCNGGSTSEAFMYIARNGGINYDRDYPYEARDGACRYSSSKPRVVIRGYAYLTGPDENMLMDMVATQGPISVAIDVSGNWGSYKSGVYYSSTCSSTSLNHAVVIVGYGNENGQDYWLVKNSWGSGWGQNGYIKMARNRGNNCGIATFASYPVF